MKTRALKLFTLLMFLTFFLYDCKDKDADTLGPANNELSNELDKVEMSNVKLEETPDIRLEQGKVETSTKTQELNSSLGTVTSGNIPASVSKAASEVSASLSDAEVKKLAQVTTAQASSKTTLTSAEVQAILKKVAQDARLQGYLSLLTLPKVEGLNDPGRTTGGGTVQGDVSSPAVEANNSDDCVQRANEKFDRTKEKLDDSKAKALDKINDAYAKDLEKIQKNYEKCVGDKGPQYYEALRNAGIKVAENALAALDKAKPFLSPQQYDQLKALINAQLLDYLDKVNKLEAAKTATCTEIADLAKARALQIKDANTARVEASYAEALAKATELRDKMIANCHNQGGGN
ncbi:hypothetical protein [Dyadobacter sp. MSC1_007]|uniref:hypothetical protein n=1 Tax=Dyadobacter sp. MSC1_007 TaxID=2909264 RepID=UPI00202E13EF|nr:hypothetical protein [Dyadobacter sp. MSC1_007]